MTTTEIAVALSCGRSGCKCAAAGRAGIGLVHCPAHVDEAPSMSIKPGDRIPTVIHCHAGCTFLQVRDAMEVRGIVL